MTGLPQSRSPMRGAWAAYAQTLRLAPMQVADVPAVEAIERAMYEHPWTKGNFLDSLASGYESWAMFEAGDVLVGYFLLMNAPDEAHLLNITLRRDCQGRGLARLLLEKVFALARARSAQAILLEVRPSNPHALAVYQHVGFRQIGLRKGYYPAANQTREDAIVMRREL